LIAGKIGLSERIRRCAVEIGGSPAASTVARDATTMKLIRSTGITSMNGMTFISRFTSSGSRQSSRTTPRGWTVSRG